MVPRGEEKMMPHGPRVASRESKNNSLKILVRPRGDLDLHLLRHGALFPPPVLLRGALSSVPSGEHSLHLLPQRGQGNLLHYRGELTFCAAVGRQK